MGICTGEDLTPGAPAEPVEREERRQEGGSEIGKERAQQIAGDFEYATNILRLYSKSLPTALRIEGRELINSLLESSGIVALKRLVRPTTLVLGVPEFREMDTLGDIRDLVRKACDKLASMDIAKAPEDRKALVDEEWGSRTRNLLLHFDTAAKLTHLDKKHSSVFSRIGLESGEEK